MADTQTFPPSTPGNLPSGDGPDFHSALRHLEDVLGWLKDHLIQSPDTSLRQYDRSLAQTGSVRQAPDPEAAAPSGMSADVLARAASRTPTQYQTGNPGGSEAAPSTSLLTPEAFAQLIKAKHPELAPVPDRLLVAQWLEKYPVYRDRVVPTASEGSWENRGVGGAVWHPASGASEGHRVDNSLLGLPPETAVAGGVPIVRAVLAPATSLAARGAAGATAAVVQAAPTIKYEIIRGTLQSLGVPAGIAIPTAMLISGYRKGTPPAAATTAEATPASLALSAAEEADLLRRGIKPKMIAQIRANLNAAQQTAATPAPAPESRGTATGPPAPSLPPPLLTPPAPAVTTPSATVQPPVAAAGAKATLAAGETKEFLRLMKAGKTREEAMDLIVAQRDMVKRLGLPSTEEVRQAVTRRNATGRWSEEP